jgi:hypothetical protein
MVEWLILLLHIREAWVKILAQRLAILTEIFVIFLNPSRQMLGWYCKIRPQPLPSKSFSFIHSPIILSFDAI